MSQCLVFPVALSGSIQVPGDKSISQRAALLASIASGPTHIKGFLNGDDAKSTLSAMEKIGAIIEYVDDSTICINGITDLKSIKSYKDDPLDLGNSGTGARLLAGLLAGMGIDAKIIGDNSLSSRPMMRIKEPLEQMGARIELTGDLNTLPMNIVGRDLKGIRYDMPVASAQVKSCILFASLFAEGPTTVIEPYPTRDHTEKLFELFNIPLLIQDSSITVQGYGASGPNITGRSIEIPGDFSSASFWLVAAAARPNTKIKIINVGLNPRRTALINVLKRMGVTIDIELKKSFGDLIGDLTITGNRLCGTVIEGDEIPNLIDELPILSVAGALANGVTVIKDAEELRVKESDRISEMVKNLRLFGVEVEEKSDGMVIFGPSTLVTPSVALKSQGDHRIAMSLAILNTYSDAPLLLDDISCVDTSYPDFWKDMLELGGKIKIK